jgi:hypothetical protein
MFGKSSFSGWREWRVAQDTEFGKVGFVGDFDHFSPAYCTNPDRFRIVSELFNNGGAAVKNKIGIPITESM